MAKLRSEERRRRAGTLDLATPRADRDGVLTWALTEEGVAIKKGDVIARVADLGSSASRRPSRTCTPGALSAGLPVTSR